MFAKSDAAARRYVGRAVRMGAIRKELGLPRASSGAAGRWWTGRPVTCVRRGLAETVRAVNHGPRCTGGAGVRFRFVRRWRSDVLRSPEERRTPRPNVSISRPYSGSPTGAGPRPEGMLHRRRSEQLGERRRYERLLPGSTCLRTMTSSKSPAAGRPGAEPGSHHGCRVTGIDANESEWPRLPRWRRSPARPGGYEFRVANADARPALFDENSFDALLCIDSQVDHFRNRLAVLPEGRRVRVRGGRRALFTDPVVITGPVTNDELALRSSIGLFLFVPSGVNERLIEEAGFQLVRREDVTDNAARVADRWHRARQDRQVLPPGTRGGRNVSRACSGSSSRCTS